MAVRDKHDQSLQLEEILFFFLFIIIMIVTVLLIEKAVSGQ